MRVLVPALRRVMGVVACLVVPGVAAACMQCNPFLQCTQGPSGARLCFESAGMCTLLLPCSGTGARTDEPGAAAAGEALTTLSLFEAPTAGLGVNARVARRPAASALALGDEIRTELPLGALAEVGVAHGRDFDAVFADDAGEGYAVTRSVTPAGVRLEVYEVRSDVVGPRLAAETLGERERLVVPVRVEGRDRVLVLQTRDARGLDDESELRRLRRTIDGVRRRTAPRETPRLRVRPR